MKIRVSSQIWFREHGWGDTPAPVCEHPESASWQENNFISIRHAAEPDATRAIPLDGPNILKLQFDDAVEDPDHNLMLFDERIAGKIVDFIRSIDTERLLFVNCGAGISRSGAIGEVLNDYFNKHLNITSWTMNTFAV